MRARAWLGTALAAGAITAASVLAPAGAWASHSIKDGSSRSVHWSRSGTTLTQAYFVDYTGPRWPVGRSVSKWNESTKVKSYYQTTTSGCSSASVNCIGVYEYTQVDGDYGYAELAWDADAHFIEGRVKVHLNNAIKTTAADDRMTVCHELGHALGLAHWNSSTSCMWQDGYELMYPNKHDYDRLATVYNH